MMNVFKKAVSLLGPTKLDVGARFELLREAVHGTMSDFYKARDRQTGEVVGLKICDPEKTDAFEARFRHLGKPCEGEIASHFDDDRIIHVREHGRTVNHCPYLVMEYFEGAGLNTHIIRRNRDLIGKRLELIRQMTQAVAAVHRAGFIHRDICPRNFIVSLDLTELKLIDFGLTVPNRKEFNGPGNRTGTPSYMAPEIARRRATDERVDLFALGVSAYQLLSFELPWPGGDTTGKAALRHDAEEPVPLLEVAPGIHPELARLTMKCLHRDPAQRPKSAAELLNSLRLIRNEGATPDTKRTQNTVA